MNTDQRIIDAIRVISAEGIQKANSGHPGICLGSAPIIYTLFNNFLKFNSSNPKFCDRDRFILSAGHGSMMLYTVLHLFGYNVSKNDLMNFRQYGSLTPGHPEYNHTDGVEITTGPLGQGIANAVGMAMAESHLASVFNKDGFNVVDHYTYALCGDGCNMEGISYEAASLAGTLKLGKLIVLYDKNNITIEGNTDIAFAEDVGARYQAMGWQVLYVSDANNTQDIVKAIEQAKAEKNKPSFVVINSVIGYGSPKAGSASVHGAPLGEDGITALRQALNYTTPSFEIPEEVKPHLNEVIQRGVRAEEEWKAMFKQYAVAYPDLAKEFELWQSGKFDVSSEIAKLSFGDKPEATRNTGFKCINAVSKAVPSLFGGSADLTPSNKTNMTEREDYSASNYSGSNVHFGIREHAMSAICNGIAAHGGVRPYCSTFFVFSDYMKNGVRLSALMDLPVTYILTHDSIGVGEDGPTHEPVEQLVGLRSIPNFNVYRPCDGEETKAVYAQAFNNSKPCAIVLSRQNLPQIGNYEGALKGGYALVKQANPDVVIIATGSEVQLAVLAQQQLHEEGIRAQVVSMPCVEVFEQQSDSYKESVIPSSVKARVCVEAGSSYSWYKYAGTYGEVVSIDTFGASAPYDKLFQVYGITADNVVAKAKNSIAKAK